MSRPIDYSRFDKIGDSDSDDDENITPAQTKNANQSLSATTTSNSSDNAPLPQPQMRTKRDASTGRYLFQYNNRTIYEWDQNLEEVNIYIDVPPAPAPEASQFQINIQTSRLQVGIKSHDRFFIDEPTFDKVVTNESCWYLDENDVDRDETETRVQIHIVLIKAHRGQVWDAALISGDASVSESGGNSASASTVVDPLTQEAMRRDMMIEKFQEENPGFDFRNAEFNGQVPNPREFMGGVQYR
jgi:hypothetical protein